MDIIADNGDVGRVGRGVGDLGGLGVPDQDGFVLGPHPRLVVDDTLENTAGVLLDVLGVCGILHTKVNESEF